MKNSQKGFVVPLLVAIIAVLVIGGGVYVYENKKVEIPAVVDSAIQQSNQIQQTDTQNSIVTDQQNNLVTKTSSATNQVVAKPSITVISPNGQEIWQEGKVYPIKWSAKNIPGNQTIRLVDANNSVIRVIDSNVNTVNGGTGLYQYSWSIPQAFVSEASPGKFRISISSSDSTVSDYSDNQFTIFASGANQAQPSITVLSPNGGENIPFGSIYMAGDLGFTWKTSLGTNYRPTSEFYAALIDENNTVVRSDQINSKMDAGNGVYSSSFIGESKIQINKKYKVRVCDEIELRKVSCDESDNYFIVADPNAPLITVLSPSAGSVLRVGQSYQITWSGNFEQGDEVFGINIFSTKSDTFDTIATVSHAQASCSGSGMGHWADSSTCSYTWTPTYTNPSLRVQVFNNSNGNQFGYSGVFSIIQ